MMTKLLFFIPAIALLAVTACTKVNKDQPCGTYQYQNVTEQLFKDSNGNCYYIDGTTGQKTMVPNSSCGC
ncbi:hypothetical protein [Mucilaginibacter sp. PPCGB 2223]|uniref:hypothetical protein n=1 Tax=Mucilaginibacter sp. PPCGB 2223 TaxID=1886027 RepID=UPI001111DCC2|nr:hypothetical protein [Mucilaginibacter sp. PPCGB 2223]